MSQVTIIDSGVANVGSVVAALQRLGADVQVSRDWEQIRRAERIVLPGVGAAAAAMRELRALDLDLRLPTLTQPLLGVCLGMQLLYEASEEGADAATPLACLGVLPGCVRRLRPTTGVRVPHMGWNSLVPLRAHPLVAGLTARDYAYFVHSYAVPVMPETLLACEHGERFTAVVGRGNFFGAQFHPERSAAVGARLLQNFLDLPDDQFRGGLL